MKNCMRLFLIYNNFIFYPGKHPGHFFSFIIKVKNILLKQEYVYFLFKIITYDYIIATPSTWVVLLSNIT